MSGYTPQQQKALRVVKYLLEEGAPLEEALSSSLIPADMRSWVADELEREANRTYQRARVISAAPEKYNWLADVDREHWYYWPTLRRYLLGVKNRSRNAVSSLDDASDAVLRELRPPSTPSFDVRGLVLGYVQSGKTANFSALIAKAADTGYRLFIVFSGVDNGLRRQTQIRLSKELVGYSHNPRDSVPWPPVGKQWQTYTSDDFNGDFDQGRSSYAALQGADPVLMVVKKNPTVLRRLKAWLLDAPPLAKSRLPVLFVDDEADQASVDAKGSLQTEAT